jgi:hypothetical protein
LRVITQGFLHRLGGIANSLLKKEENLKGKWQQEGLVGRQKEARGETKKKVNN